MIEKTLEKFRKNKNAQIVFIETFLIFISFWFLLKGLKTDGIWETVALSFLFFFVFPFLIYKQRKEEFAVLKISSKEKVKKIIQVFGILVAFWAFVSWLPSWSFLKMNPLSRVEWFVGDWWVLVLLDLILLPVILFSQEFFFRKFLMSELKKNFSRKLVLIIQALIFVAFEILFFGVFSWQFILLNFFLALLWGGFYLKTRSIWYSFFARWGLILILEGFVLARIQDIKI